MAKVYRLKSDSEKRDFKIDYEEELNREELNREQLEVVFNGDGASLVLAGPGSGKTRVLVYRVAYLIEKGVSPENILLLTFTNKAAKNMLSRVERLLGYYPKGLTGGTFHHVGNLVLRKHAKLVGFNDNFSIIDNEDSRQLIKDIVAATVTRKDGHFPRPGVIFSVISFAKNSGVPIDKCVKENYDYLSRFTSDIKKIAEAYEQRKKGANLMDFDDLLYQWNRLLDVGEMREKYSSKFKYVLVDEFQDTNRLQFEVIKKLAGARTNNIMAVGDDCQSIYSFRAADVKNILSFPEHFENTSEFRLATNYRSTPEILDLINNSIKNNKNQFEKTLNTVNKPGGLPVLVRCKDTRQEAEFVCQKILELREEGIPYREMGILFRADYQSVELELELMKRGIPFEKRGGMRFFEQAHIKDVTSFLKIFDNSRDELAWKRVLCLFDGIGPAAAIDIWGQISKHAEPLKEVVSGFTPSVPGRPLRGWDQFKTVVKEICGKVGAPSEMVNVFFERYYKQYLQETYPNFTDRMMDIRQYINLADQYVSITNFLEDITLDADLTNREGPEITGGEKFSERDDEEPLVLSTIHQAKGLEWRAVFLTSVSEGRFPMSRVYGDVDLEEERRLFYVACSRAKKELYLTAPMEEFTHWGGYGILDDSVFVQELPKECYDEWTLRDEEL